MKIFATFSICIPLFFLTLTPTPGFSKSVKEDPNYSYEVLFTNPTCAYYNYLEEILSNDGEILKNKPKDSYCTSRDKEASGYRESAPQQRLVDWIKDPAVTSISLAYYSFSDKRVLQELCTAIERGVKVRLVLDSDNENEPSPLKLKTCGGELIVRGHKPGIELAHIKLVLFELQDTKILKTVFSSGNLTSGTVLHHENWNFVTNSRDSYFAQDQLCAYDGMIAAQSGAEFRTHMKTCRLKIQAIPEDDLKSYFIPADNKQALTQFILNIQKSEVIKIAAHRFSNKKMLAALNERLSNKGVVQLLVDDDVYWAQKGTSVGPNTKVESEKIKALETNGAVVQYLETNHYEKLLHHNKFIIFDTNSVWTGAGNLSDAGFSGNYENFYYITIPEVVQAFQIQYGYLWKALSTPWNKMPQRLAKPHGAPTSNDQLEEN